MLSIRFWRRIVFGSISYIQCISEMTSKIASAVPSVEYK